MIRSNKNGAEKILSPVFCRIFEVSEGRKKSAQILFLSEFRYFEFDLCGFCFVCALFLNLFENGQKNVRQNSVSVKHKTANDGATDDLLDTLWRLTAIRL